MKLTARRGAARRPSFARLTAVPRLQRRVPLPLVLILVAAALLSLAWDVALPAFQGPDESAHFAYVQHLAETGTIPSTSVGNSPNSSEVQTGLDTLNLNSLVGDANARPAWSSADLALWHREERNLPRGDGSGPNPIASNPPLYYALMTVPYRVFVWLPLLQRLFVLRLVNALCFLATVALTWMLAGDLFRGVRWKQTLAAGAVALQPQLGSISAVINADNLLIALTTGFILAAVRLAMYGPSLRRVIIASALAAAASLTHGRGLVTVPVLCVALLVAVIRDRPPLLAIASRAAVAGGFVAGALLVDYLVENSSGGGSLYGGQVTNLNTTSAFSLRQFASFAYQFFFPRLASLRPRIGPSYGYRQVFIDTFYATFASLEVAFKPRVADVLQVASALGLVGFYTACVARWRTLVRDWGPVVVMLTMVIVQVVFLLYVSYQALLNNLGTDPLIVGRYLLPIVSLFGVAIAFTVGSLPRRAGPVLGAAILAVGLLLCLGGVAITAARFYA